MSEERITVYEKPTCTTCRSLVKLLEEEGIEFERVDYFVEPLSERKLNMLLEKAGLTARELLRVREPAYRTLGLADPSRSEAELIRAMVEHPELVQRPIVERGDRAVLARPVENVRALL